MTTTSIAGTFMRRSILLLSLLAAAPLSAQSYFISHTYTLGGDGRWDLVLPDAPNHRLFIARADRLMVVDMNDGRLITEIPGFNAAHATALVPALRRGFATSGGDSSVIMFDSRTYKVLGKIPAAEDADAIAYEPVSKRIFTFNGDANSSTVIDPRKGTVITTIPLGGKPEDGVAARTGMLYVNITDSSQVAEIDARTMRVTRRWSTAPCKNPVSMAIDTRRHRLFSGCRSGVMAISDYTDGRVITTVPIGAGNDGAGYDPVQRDAYASNLDGTLTVIHQDTPDTYHVAESVQTAEGGRNMGLDAASHRIYVVSAKFGPMPADSSGANSRRRPPILPGTFMVMVVEPVGSH